MIKISASNIVGSATENSWSQSQSVNLGELKTLYIVVQLKHEEGDSTLIDLVSLGSEILAEVEKNVRIEGAAQLQQIVDKVMSEVGPGLELELMAGVLDGDALVVYGRGELGAYLARDEKLARLGDGTVMSAPVKGRLAGGDRILLATDKFVEAISLEKLREVIRDEDKPAELLAPLIHTQNETSGLAAIVGEVSDLHEKVNWPQIRLNLSSSEPRKINLWIGGVILVLLLIMVGVGMVRKARVAAEQEFSEVNTSVSVKIEEALTVGELNPEQARNLIATARGEITAYLNTDLRPEYVQKAQKISSYIDQAEEQTFKKNSIVLETIVELQVLDENLRATQMKSDGKQSLIFLDERGNKLVAMNLGDRSRQTISVDSGDNLVDMGISDSRVFGLSDSGVREYSWRNSTEKKVIEPDDFWQEPLMMETFAANIYVLDRGQSEIWKYATLGESFGGRGRWFAAGIEPDLANVVDMKIGGDIWLLTSSGKLERYSRGAPVAFSLEGFPATGESKRFSNPRAMWVSESLVYVLESGAERVVVFDMEGRFREQYVNPEFGEATDLVVVDDKGYVIVGNAVKEFGL